MCDVTKVEPILRDPVFVRKTWTLFLNSNRALCPRKSYKFVVKISRIASGAHLLNRLKRLTIGTLKIFLVTSTILF